MLVETFVLCMCASAGCYVSILNLSNNPLPRGYKFVVILFAQYCILGPFVEEAIFRNLIKSWLGDHEFANCINAFIFGCFHIPNYLFTKDKLSTLVQMITTTYLGYYIMLFNDFFVGLAVHSAYNAVVIGVVIAYNKVCLNDLGYDSESYKPCCMHNKEFVFCYPFARYDDGSFVVQKQMRVSTPYKNIPKTNITQDQLDRISKLQTVLENRSVGIPTLKSF